MKASTILNIAKKDIFKYTITRYNAVIVYAKVTECQQFHNIDSGNTKKMRESLGKSVMDYYFFGGFSDISLKWYKNNDKWMVKIGHHLDNKGLIIDKDAEYFDVDGFRFTFME